jgi:hypothetical protein
MGLMAGAGRERASQNSGEGVFAKKSLLGPLPKKSYKLMGWVVTLIATDF